MSILDNALETVAQIGPDTAHSRTFWASFV